MEPSPNQQHQQKRNKKKQKLCWIDCSMDVFILKKI
jgi:hypothetical protein